MFSKLYASIAQSSIWSEDLPTRVLFVTLLAKADSEGYIFGSLDGMARAANLPLDATAASFAKLLGPDPDSSDLDRNPDGEGRRIERVSGGWRLLNYAFYRDTRTADDRRFRARMKKRGQRSGQRALIVLPNGDIVPRKPGRPRSGEKLVPQPVPFVSPSDSEGIIREEELGKEPSGKELGELWNRVNKRLPAIREVKGARLRHAQARLREEPSLETWGAAFARLDASDFACGLVAGDRKWNATFDWILVAGNLAKVLEGKYDNRAGTPGLTGQYADVKVIVRKNEAP